MATPVQGKAAVPAAAAPGDKYASEPLVIEQMRTIYRFAADGTGERTIYARTRMQSDAAARQWSVLNVGYAGDNEQVDMHFLRVHKADGTTVETPLTDAQDMPAEVTRIAPFYSDLRQKQYPIRSLGAGDTLEYEGVVHMKKAQAIDPSGTGQFWGAESMASGAVTLDQTIELHVPRARAVIVVSPRCKPVITEVGDERVYVWHGNSLKPTIAPPGAAKEAAADDGKGLPDIAWTSFKDWAAVGDWYRSLAMGRAAVTPELKAKAAALTAGATAEEEKVRRIYAYVSTNIRYIGVAFGVGRYQPHTAGEVLGNQYGDCKDKHTLLAALLAAAGFEASPVLIGQGIKFNADVPSPGSFNHVITAVTVKGPVSTRYTDEPAGSAKTMLERIWLDSTAEVAPFGMLNADLRGKPALLMPAEGAPVLVQTPALLPFTAFDHWEARATLDKDGKLKGHFDVTARGDIELLLRWSLHQTMAAQWPQLGQNLSSNFGFGGTVTDFTPASAEQTTQPLHYSYDYERDTYGDWPNHRILSLVPYGLFSMAQMDKEPNEPITLGNPRTESARSTIHLPEGYTAKLPDAVHVRSSFASYDVTYSAKAGDVICETRLEMRASSLSPEEWGQYNAFAQGIQDNSEIYIQLEKTGEIAAAPTTTLAAPGAANNTVTDVGAEALLNQAWELVKKAKLPDAQEKLEAARKLNPEQRGLWATAAVLAGIKNHPEEAEADYGKEVALHPDNDYALLALAQLQVYRKERPQAIESYQKLLKLKSGDVGVTQTLAGLLTREKRYPEALTLLESAALRNGGNKQLLLELGRTQLAAGRNEEGVATLQSALEDATDPLVLNDAAYELASHHADLPLAESSARKALAALDAETQKFTLGSVTAFELVRTSMLSATWDTLGWIEFENGNAMDAEPLLAAAWANAQRPEMGYHLGRAYGVLGKPKQALETYRAAQAAMGATESFAGSDELAPRIAALEKGGATAPPFDRNDLGGGRIYNLPLLTKQKTEGDYFLLLSAGKVEAASWISGDEEMKRLETKLVTALQPAMFAANKPPLFPGNSGAKQIRRGVVSCSPLLHGCMVVLMLPQDVRPEVKPITIAQPPETAKK